MIALPPYIPEWMAYRSVPVPDRWIYNKLELARRFGYPADPVGLRFPAGVYCLRPIMNLRGMAAGGFKKLVLEREDFIHEPPGFVVTPWNDGPRSWHQYVDDRWNNGQRLSHKEGEIEHYVETTEGPPLPRELQGISRYLLVERLGDEIIDVGTRHMLEEVRDDVVADYRQINQDYQVPSWCDYGFRPLMRTYEKDGWYYHEEVEEHNVRPTS